MASIIRQALPQLIEQGDLRRGVGGRVHVEHLAAAAEGGAGVNDGRGADARRGPSPGPALAPVTLSAVLTQLEPSIMFQRTLRHLIPVNSRNEGSERVSMTNGGAGLADTARIVMGAI